MYKIGKLERTIQNDTYFDLNAIFHANVSFSKKLTGPARPVVGRPKSQKARRPEGPEGRRPGSDLCCSAAVTTTSIFKFHFHFFSFIYILFDMFSAFVEQTECEIILY